mgnify:FL=1
MRLFVALVDYSDGPAVQVDDVDIDIVYDTDPVTLPYLVVSLRDIPNGTFTATLTGSYTMTGDLEGPVTIDVAMTGTIEDNETGGIRRVGGDTEVIGTATAGDGIYDIEVTI